MKRASKRLINAIIALVASVILCIGVCLAWFAMNNNVSGEGMQTQVKSGDIVDFKVTAYYLDYSSSNGSYNIVVGNNDAITDLSGEKITVDYNGDTIINSSGDKKDVMRPYSLSNEYTTAVLFKVEYEIVDGSQKKFRIFAECPDTSRITVTNVSTDKYTSDLSNTVDFVKATQSAASSGTSTFAETEDTVSSYAYSAEGNSVAFLNELREKSFHIMLNDNISIASLGDEKKNANGNYENTEFFIMDYEKEMFSYISSLLIENGGGLNSGLTFTGDITLGIEEYDPAEVVTLTSIAVDTHAGDYETAYTQSVGSVDMMTANWQFVATYSDGTQKVIVSKNNNLLIDEISTTTVGKRTVTATYTEGGVSKSCSVEYTIVPAITGGSGVAVNDENGLQLAIDATGLTNYSVAWSSSKESVATVDQNGKVTPIAVGTTIITATTTVTETTAEAAAYALSGGVSTYATTTVVYTSTYQVTVTAAKVAVTGVTLDKSELELEIGQPATLTATVSPSNATNKAVTWSSSNTSVATVSNGKVVAKGNGTAKITVTTLDGSKTATCTVTVTTQSYTVTFSANGVTTTSMPANQSIVSGGKVTEPADPAATGYTFVGWYTDTTYTTPFDFANTTISSNITIYAKWEAKTQYTVTFNMNGHGTNTEVKVYDGDKAEKPTDPTATGYAFKGWYTDAACSDGNEFSFATAITEDTTLYAKWANAYTVTFKNGEETLQTGEVEENTKPTYNGSTPTKDADAQYTYTFSGWSSDGGTTVYASAELPVVTGAVTYVAQFSQTTRKYTVTWKNYDGSTLETDTNVAYGTTPSYDSTEPARTADAQYTYTFSGWNDGTKSYGKAETLPTVSGDVTYTATFSTTLKQYTYTFYVDGTEYKTATVDYGTQIVAPDNPTKADYTFDGWYTAESGGEKVETFGTISGNVSYYAHWTSTSTATTVILFYDGATYDSNVVTIAGEAYNSNTSNGVIEYTYGGTTYKKPLKMQSSTTVTLKSVPANSTITIFVGNDSAGKTGKIIVGGTTYTAADGFVTVEATTAGNYEIKRSDTLSLCYVIISTGGSSATPKYTVTFKNGEETLQTGEVEKDTKPTYSGEIPTKASTAEYTYTFSGWSSDGGTTVYASAELPEVTGAVTYVAQFSQTTRQYTVTFNMNGHGSAIDKQEIEYNKTATEPTEPTATGYDFGGWYTDEACSDGNEFSFTTAITEDTTLYAKWTASSLSEAVTYQLDIANSGATASVFSGTAVVSGDGGFGTSDDGMNRFKLNTGDYLYITLDLKAGDKIYLRGVARPANSAKEVPLNISLDTTGSTGTIGTIGDDITCSSYGVLISKDITVSTAGTIKLQLKRNDTTTGVEILNLFVGVNQTPTVSTPSVTISGATDTVDAGKTIQLSATYTSLTAPTAATTWSTSNANVATVEKGKVSGVSEGSAGITVTIGGITSTSYGVTVNPAAATVESVTVTAADNATTVEVGKTLQLSATVNGSNNPGQGVTWSIKSGATATGATISDSGLLSAGSTAGSVTIVATSTVDASKSGEITITVVVPVTSVSLDYETATLQVGGTQTLNVTFNPTNATNKNVTWSTSDDTVATVADGVVTALKAGTATITVTTEDGNKTATCEVTVSAASSGTTYQFFSSTKVGSTTSGTALCNSKTAYVLDENFSVEGSSTIKALQLSFGGYTSGLYSDSNSATTKITVAKAGTLTIYFGGTDSKYEAKANAPSLTSTNTATIVNATTTTVGTITVTVAAGETITITSSSSRCVIYELKLVC